jgi:hypothetical protein
MKYQIALLICTLSILATASCAPQSGEAQAPAPESATSSEEPGPAEEGSSAEESEPATKTATPKDSWVSDRVLEAQDRLSNSEAGELLLSSIEAHGGLERWYANGPLYFRFNYRPLEGTARDTYQTVDTWASKARHQLAGDKMAKDKNVEFGWDGESAWISPAGAEINNNARFWALTPYYFVAMPFVLADPGVNLEKTGTAELHGKPHDVIMATFGDDVGDSPDDYYVIYLDAETSRFGGLRYVVSYPGFFPEGGHSPEKLMVYEGDQVIDGITLAKQFPTYKWDPQTKERGEKVTEVTMTDVEFRPETLDSYFAAPEGAQVLEGY